MNNEQSYDVLVERLDGLKELMIEKFNNNAREHETILSRTDSFRERIDTLETKVERLENWKSYTLGIIAAMGIIAGLVTYIYFNDINTIKTDLQKHIEATLK